MEFDGVCFGRGIIGVVVLGVEFFLFEGVIWIRFYILGKSYFLILSIFVKNFYKQPKI